MESGERDYEALEGTAHTEVERDDRGLTGSYDNALGDAGNGTRDWQSPEQAREDRVVDALEQVEGLRPEVWEAATPEERLDALREAEASMCAVDGRPVPAVESYDAQPGEYGAYDPGAQEISLGSWLLEQESPQEVVNTLAHEDSHDYQDWAMEHPDAHPNSDEIEAWRQNRDQYISYDEDPVLYRQQPLEADAWDYGDRIVARLYEGRL